MTSNLLPSVRTTGPDPPAIRTVSPSPTHLDSNPNTARPAPSGSGGAPLHAPPFSLSPEPESRCRAKTDQRRTKGRENREARQQRTREQGRKERWRGGFLASRSTEGCSKGLWNLNCRWNRRWSAQEVAVPLSRGNCPGYFHQLYYRCYLHLYHQCPYHSHSCYFHYQY